MHYEFSNKELEALKVIRNYLMANNKIPSVRDLMKELNYKSPRSASVIIQKLITKGVLKRKSDGDLMLDQFEINNESEHRAQTVKIPLLGTIACGIPILAEENIEAEIPVSVKLISPSNRYFLLKASGDSMNESGINDGDLVLIKQQPSANNGDKVVALIDDEATIKEFWNNGNTIVLKPKSTNKKHQPIILTQDFKIQGIVVSVIPI
jgi:repressor LexA